MEIDNQELSQYIKSLLDGIKKGIDGHDLVEPIEVELSIINKESADGKLKVVVASAEGNYSKETVSKIRFRAL